MCVQFSWKKQPFRNIPGTSKQRKKITPLSRLVFLWIFSFLNPLRAVWVSDIALIEAFISLYLEIETDLFQTEFHFIEKARRQMSGAQIGGLSGARVSFCWRHRGCKGPNILVSFQRLNSSNRRCWGSSPLSWLPGHTHTCMLRLLHGACSFSHLLGSPGEEGEVGNLWQAGFN